MRRLNPGSIHPPFANYAHGVETPAGLGSCSAPDNSASAATASSPKASRRRPISAFAAIAAILGEAGMTLADLVRLNAYVTSAEHLGGYMRARDQFVSNPPPASTLMIVSGFARPEFKVEVEAIAARAP